MGYANDYEAVLAWGQQRPLPDRGVVDGEGKRRSQKGRYFSDFYGVDEPSLNSFVYAQHRQQTQPPPTKRRFLFNYGSSSAQSSSQRRPLFSRSTSLFNFDKARKIFAVPCAGRREVSNEVAAVVTRDEDEVTPENIDERIRKMERKLEARRTKHERNKMRIAELETEEAMLNEQMPALFEELCERKRIFKATENAQMIVIGQLQHDFNKLLSEKEQAARLLASIIGPTGSPHGVSSDSTSTASEGTSEGDSSSSGKMDHLRKSGNRARRVQSLGPYGRPRSRRRGQSLFTSVNTEFRRSVR